MKKSPLILLFALSAFVCAAQSTTPRFGTRPNENNTGSQMTYGFLSPVATATTVLIPNKAVNYYAITSLTLSPQVNFTVTSSKMCDKVVILASALSASRTITFAGNVLVTAATMTIASGKYAMATFVFNGANYVEVSRSTTQ